jgi:hypothetical protein
MSALRIAGTTFVLFLVTAVRSQDKPNPDSARNCGLCHTEIHKEWLETAHAQAWVDPVYQAAIKDRPRSELCHKCHKPDAVLERAGRQPKPREALVDEGVSCTACHKFDGKVHGPFGAATDAHPSEKSALFTTDVVTLCRSCHDTKIGPVLALARSFDKGKFKEDGKTCTTCHMPEVERPLAVQIATGQPAGPARKGRSHRIHGPNDKEFLSKAFSWKTTVEGQEVVFHLRNEAGHQVPGLTLRKFKLICRLHDKAGKEIAKGEITFSDENPLLEQETRAAPKLTRPEQAQNAAVELEYTFDGKLKHRIDLGQKPIGG